MKKNEHRVTVPIFILLISLVFQSAQFLPSPFAAEDDILVAWVPGSCELPLTAKTLAETGRYDSIICLGAVVRGETSHYDLVAEQASRGISQVSMETGVPVMFGVLTTETIDQAINRAGGKAGNVGSNAAQGAIEMSRLMQTIRCLKVD